MGQKAMETTYNINSAFGPETANQHTVKWWFKKLCTGDESREDGECSDQPSEVDSDQLTERITETGPLTATRAGAQELSVDHPVVI